MLLSASGAPRCSFVVLSSNSAGRTGRRGPRAHYRDAMEPEAYWGPGGDEADDRDAVAPLLRRPGATGGVEPPDNHAAAAGAAAAARSNTPSATGARASWRREVVAPAMVAAARVSARLVSSSGPVAAQHARRGLRRGLRGSGLPRRDVLPGGSEAAASEQRRSVRSSRNEPGGDLEERTGEEDHSLAAQGSLGLSFGDGMPGAVASLMEADDSGGESSSQASSDSEGGSSANPMVVANPPEEVRRALASSHNTIALLLLLLLHFVVTHIMGLACVVLGSAAIVGLDRRLRSHADAQVLKSRFVLLGVAVTAVLLVALSATVLNNFPEGDHLLRGLLLMEPKPDVCTVYAVIRTTVVVDLWARLLSVTIKAVLAVVSVPGSSNAPAPGLCARGRLAVCGHRVCGGFRGGGGAEGGTRRRESPLPRGARTSTFDADDENGGGNGDGRGGAGGGAGSGIRRAWRVCLCCSERFFGGPYRFGRPSASGRDGNDAGEAGGRDGSGAGGTGILLSRAGRQRRVYAIVEMTFMLYRCLLPVPVWLEFYGKESDYFSALYLVLKGMEVSFRSDRLVRAVCYVRRGDLFFVGVTVVVSCVVLLFVLDTRLDRGKFATPEEVSEVGSPDCSICYDQMVRPLILPCKHLFCGSCVAEWLERERTCPLCRDEVPTSNPIPKALRDGRTAIVPQVL